MKIIERLFSFTIDVIVPADRRKGRCILRVNIIVYLLINCCSWLICGNTWKKMMLYCFFHQISFQSIVVLSQCVIPEFPSAVNWLGGGTLAQQKKQILHQLQLQKLHHLYRTISSIKSGLI